MATTPEAVALGVALTGEELPLSRVDALGEELACLGFPDERLRALREERRGAQQPYPFPVPLDLLRAVGFARFDALLSDVRANLGLASGAVPPAHDRPLNADERRLAADRPPHWG